MLFGLCIGIQIQYDSSRDLKCPISVASEFIYWRSPNGSPSHPHGHRFDGQGAQRIRYRFKTHATS